MSVTRQYKTTMLACALTVFGARVGLASELDSSTGKLIPSNAQAIMIGFDDAAQLASLGVALTKYQTSGSGYYQTAKLVFVDSGGTPMTSAELDAHLAPDPPVEGGQALLLGAGPQDGATGILIPWKLLASQISKQKIRVTVWVRSNGASPRLTVTYGKGELPMTGDFTSVTAIRTGRETSDGWAELTTGPIDTAIWDVPLAQITVSMSSSDLRRNANATLVIDALEVAALDGTPVPPNECTIAKTDASCGPDGECQFGHCIPAYATWGPTPSADHRAAFVDRWIAIAKYIQGARNAVANAEAIVAARPALTAATIGGRAFFTTMMGLVNGLRNHHTNFGYPANGGLLQPLAAGGSSSTLGACAGVGELDLLESNGKQQLGFIIYQVAKTSVVGANLKVGDAITKIDGIDPLQWVRSVYLPWSPGVPSDPGADMAWASPGVAWMISHRASTMEITRCASSTDCTGDKRQVIQIDVDGPAWKNLKGTGWLGNDDDPNILECSVRFQDALTVQSSSDYGDVVSSQTIWGDTLAFQFDGTLADFSSWQSSIVSAFSTSAPPTKVLFDVRQGNGGYAQNSEIIAEEIRDKVDAVGAVGFPSACWDRSDSVSALMSVVLAASPSCESNPFTSSAPCVFLQGDYFLGDYYAQVSYEDSQVKPFTPNGLKARVAWLQAADVSANDYLAAFVEGRGNQRVFAPGPTSGAYGTISSIPALLLGWSGGSIQMTDTVWGESHAALASKAFRSGVGVSPDVVMAQKMSDAINNVDTMLAAARNWLETP